MEGLIALWLVIGGVVGGLWVAASADEHGIHVVKGVRELCNILFANRNWFGKLLSSLIIILMLPGIILDAILELIFKFSVFISIAPESLCRALHSSHFRNAGTDLYL